MERIGNDKIRGTISVTELSKKVQERRIYGYGPVIRKGKDYIGRRRRMEMRIEESKRSRRTRQR